MLESAQAFVVALVPHWWAIVSGVLFPLLLDVPKLLPDKWEARVRGWLPRPRRVRLALITGLIGLVVAAFLAFHDERTRIDKPVLIGVRSIESRLPSTASNLPYHLKIVIQTDKEIPSPTFLLTFNGVIGSGRFGLSGSFAGTMFGGGFPQIGVLTL